MARSLGLSRSDLETSPGVLELGVRKVSRSWPELAGCLEGGPVPRPESCRDFRQAAIVIYEWGRWKVLPIPRKKKLLWEPRWPRVGAPSAIYWQEQK